jgi:hypothetical protein
LGAAAKASLAQFSTPGSTVISNNSSLLVRFSGGGSLCLLKPKTRLISFRVSEEEFCSFKDICGCEGFMSFSDLVRTAIQELIANRSGRGPTAIRTAVNELSTRIDKLGQDLKDMKTLSKSNGS